MRKPKIIRKQSDQRDCVVGSGKKISLFFAFLGLTGFMIFIVFRMSHQAEKQNSINDEIAKLQQQASELEGENQDLQEMIAYLKTDDFKEKEAKDKLNLIKEGEQMILVKENVFAGKAGLESEEKNQGPELVVHRENYYYWWHYFFSIKP